jgi:hypothetical protein
VELNRDEGEEYLKVIASTELFDGNESELDKSGYEIIE